MTLDYSSETPPRQFTVPPSLLSWVELRSGQVKLFNFRVRLCNLWQYAEAIPQHRPKQHVVCFHHFVRPMKLERNLDGRTRRPAVWLHRDCHVVRWFGRRVVVPMAS